MRIGLDISVLNDPKRTGIGVYTYNLIKAILEQDREDQFILFGIATLNSFEYLNNLDLKNYPNVEMKIYKWPAKLFRISFLLWQKLEWPKIEQFIGPVDVFHSFNWYFPPQGKGKRVATVFDMTSISHPQWHQEKTSQLDLLRFKGIAKEADLVVTISQSTKNDFSKFSPHSKVEVIYPAADETFTNKGSKQDRKVLGKYCLKPGYFLSVATLEPRKNLEGLIKGYVLSIKYYGKDNKTVQKPIIHNSSPLPQLVLVGGEGWKSEKLKQLVKDNPNIVLTGFVPDGDLPALYRNASCFVYPSFYEGFGIPVLEALKSGTPVVCSKTSSLSEVGGKAVVYIDPYDTASIKEGLLEVLGNKKRQMVIKTGLKQAEKFSWERSAEKLIRLYHSATPHTNEYHPK